MKLPRIFYYQSAQKVARELLGKYLVRNFGKKKLSAKIVETEAYSGRLDDASHAARGMTQRNQIMFGKPGYAYVYLIYGMYNCLNIVTGKEGFPAAVLIRAAELEGARGPGNLCKKFGIDRKLNETDLTANELYIEDRNQSTEEIAASKRIGIDYAKQTKDYPWRFYIKNNNYVSRIK